MSVSFPPPPREAARLSALYRYEILDTPPEKELDDIVHLASYICNTPISLISLVDSDRQWFKSKVGLAATETNRIVAFCAHAILDDHILIVPDALADERFKNNPLVTGDPHIRFYCGAPLITPDGYRIGTLNVIDYVPRELSKEQLEALLVLSRQVMDHLTLDREHRQLIQAVKQQKQTEAVLQASEAKFRTLVESSPSAIFIYQDDRIVYTNQAAANISGYSVKELLMMDLLTMGHHNFLPLLKAHLLNAQGNATSPTRFELKIIRKNGQERWLDFTTATIDYDGQPARLATGYDITKRKRGEVSLKIQRRILELIAGGAPLRDTLKTLVRSIETESDGMLASILLLDADGLHVRCGAAPSLPDSFTRAIDGQPIGPSAGSCGTAAFRRETVIVEDIATDPLWEKYRAYALPHGLRACWSTPIFNTQRQVLGTFALYFRTPGRPTTHDIRLVATATHIAALAIEREKKDHALAEKDTSLQLLIDHSPAALAMFDRDMRYLAVSRRWMADYQLPDRPMIGRSHYEVFPDLPQRWKDVHQRCLAGAIEEHGEDTFVHDDGRTIWIQWKIVPWRTAGGDIGGIVIFTEDITGRKQAVAELRVSEARLQAILDNNPLLIFLKDLGGRYLFINRMFEQKFGLSHDQVIGKTDDDLFSPKQAGVFRRNDREVVRTGAAVEFEEVSQYGDTEHAGIAVKFPLRDANGAIYALCGIVTDISDRKKAEETLRRSEERFQLVALATNDLLWDWDLITNDLWWSPNAIKKCGYDPDTEPGIEAWTSRLHSDDRDRILHSLDDSMKGREDAWTGEYRFRLHDGTYGYFVDKGHIVRDVTGKPVKMIGAMNDVTEAKQAYDSLREAYSNLQTMSRKVQTAEERERRRLSRELHDEFGQLLSAVKFDLNDIRQGLLKVRNPNVTAVRRKITSATGTVDRLFVSFREVLAALRPATLEVLGLAQSIQSMLNELQGRTGIRCRLVTNRDDIGKLCGPDVESTLYRTTQELLMNITSHAKATAATVTIDCADGWVTLTVQDDGVGFVAHHRPQEGRFGLRGIEERVEILGGSVSIRSEPGTGTDVAVRLPYASPVAPRRGKPPIDRKRRKHGKKR